MLLRIQHKVTGVIARVDDALASKLDDEWELADERRAARAATRAPASPARRRRAPKKKAANASDVDHDS